MQVVMLYEGAGAHSLVSLSVKLFNKLEMVKGNHGSGADSLHRTVGVNGDHMLEVKRDSELLSVKRVAFH